MGNSIATGSDVQEMEAEVQKLRDKLQEASAVPLDKEERFRALQTELADTKAKLISATTAVDVLLQFLSRAAEHNPDVVQIPLHKSAESASVLETSLPYLLRCGADLDKHDEKEDTILGKAIRRGNHDVVSLLLAAKADPDAVSGHKQEPPILIASQEDYPALIKTLADSSANMDKGNNWGQTALITAAKNGQLECVTVLVDAGARLDLKEKIHGTSALTEAVRAKQYECAELLLSKRADVNIQDAQGKTPLMEAAGAADQKMVELLLRFRALPKIQDAEFKTASQYVAYSLGSKDAKNAIKAMLKEREELHAVA